MNAGGRGSKYAPLRDYLQAQAAQTVTLTFRQLEEILGFELPCSARHHRAWWSNEQGANSTHTHARSWLEAGYLVESVSQDGAAPQVTFVVGR